MKNNVLTALLALVCAGTAFATKHTRRHTSSSASPKKGPASPKKDLARDRALCDARIHELKELITLASGDDKRKLEAELGAKRKERNALA